MLLIPFMSGSFSLTPSKEGTHDITVKITNIRSKKGRIQLQLYRTGKSFSAETPYKQYYVSKKSLNNKTVTYTIRGLKSGTYGVALLDDENSNKEMDYGWVLPEEGFGFSDYYHTAWSKPKFSQFKFYLSADKKVGMKVRYM
ncbi:MAG: DUF2141 domain-containing protein [Crocinitomicaceae bacterium]|nr:DUF2141 domain-containing protein [Crocinitomicaceae bacterium]